VICCNVGGVWLTHVAILRCNRHYVVLYFQTAGYNQLNGTIPTELGRLTRLTDLDLGKLKTLLCFFNIDCDWLSYVAILRCCRHHGVL
jgi:hypothetical protein